MGLLRQVTVQADKRQRDGTWINVAAASVIKESGTQTLGTYIGKQQATFLEWVVLSPILEFFDRETGYKGGGRRREPWRRQTAAWNHLRAMLEDILAEARVRCWESGRHGKGGEGGEVANYD